MTNSEKLEMLCSIIETFEELLSDYGINLPNEEKLEDNYASNIYGGDYSVLEYKIENILKNYKLIQ